MKKLYGVVFAQAEDDEYEGMAHVWMRDSETAYWFSLSRAVGADAIEVMVSDQLNYSGEINVNLPATGIVARLSEAAARALDGHHEYAIQFHPDSQDLASIREAFGSYFP